MRRSRDELSITASGSSRCQHFALAFPIAPRSECTRRAAKCTSECECEMAVTREAEVQRQTRQVASLWQLAECPGEPELSDVTVQRDTLEAAEDIRKVGRRCPHGIRDVTQPKGLAERGFEKLFR